jgi:prepilin-type N-terminal cleavage/methylation domain-containing protein
MFKQKLQRGFTLIELLVVIAIIGILAATVLAALGTARSSGSNASMQGSMSSMRAQAEIFYGGNNNSYTGVCGNGANGLAPLLTAARNNAMGGTSGATSSVSTQASVWSATVGSNVTACHESSTAWAASAPTPNATTPGTYFCVDSTGASRVTTGALTTGLYACP